MSSLQLKNLKSLIELFEVFPGWVGGWVGGWVTVFPENKNNSINIELSLAKFISLN